MRDRRRRLRRASGRKPPNSIGRFVTRDRASSCVGLVGRRECQSGWVAWTRPSSRRAKCRSAGAAGSSRSKHQPDREPVCHMVGPLAALRERRDGRDPPADQRQVERRDHHAAHNASRRLATARHGDGMTAAQPSEIARCTGAAIASSTAVRRSCGSTMAPAARPPPVRPRLAPATTPLRGSPNTRPPDRRGGR
jgi:hypothetical protein